MQALSKPLTLAGFLAQPETKPASEYINGAIIQKPMPQGKHSLLQRELSLALTLAFRVTKVAQAFPELRCTFGDRSTVPDITVFKTERIPQDENGDIANAFELYPDWTIEILSPQQSPSRVMRNILHCLDHGTELGWLIDPAEACVFVYTVDKSIAIFDQDEQLLPVPSFVNNLELTIGEIFSWLKV